ncbi:phosphopantetheine-binding protein [Clostridium butyricum]|jgi:acyl carrier protein|uniref:phosphopantetheine-binding protein n=1 Tax=Clostridium butyricum TaxID=1492 RepID=UPI001BA4E0DB|nr:phosphopantetheine-binding protein [Clostridium butyricum]MDU1005637.1 phosphopantetheine-binding protein [Clostridium butyricum]QUF83677.1 DUF1493 family protein [Clostridium butyricum]
MLEKLQEIFSSQFSISKNEITLETKLEDDLDLDSVDLFVLISEFENTFDVTIPDDFNVSTIGDIVDVISNLKTLEKQ